MKLKQLLLANLLCLGLYAQLPSYLNPNLTYGSVSDVDGNNYATIAIGNQVWMAENLKTSKFNTGEAIQNVTDDNQWGTTTNSAWTYYDNYSLYENPYGKLYNYYAVIDPRKICPEGWHVPIDAEWTFLTNYLGGLSIAGGKMKSIGNSFWNTPNNGATNESGFSSLPGGWRGNVFYELGTDARIWSSTTDPSGNIIYRRLYTDYYKIDREFGSKNYGLSVRCLSDFPNSINELNQKNNFKIKSYPNIVIDYLTVEYILNYKEYISITLTSLEGKKIKEFSNRIQNEGFNRIQLDIVDVPPGLYFLNVNGLEFNAYTKINKQ
jgi:uncharacterized protein (TIGR02145 family)